MIAAGTVRKLLEMSSAHGISRKTKVSVFISLSFSQFGCIILTLGHSKKITSGN